MKRKHWFIRFILGILVLLFLIIGIYYIYLETTYYRIDDEIQLETQNNRLAGRIETGQLYTLSTYNIGFGAYEPSYTFFMDTGRMKDGTKTQGSYSRAYSRERELTNTKGSLRTLQNMDCDFYFVQEADMDSTRSYQVNQVSLLKNEFPDYGSVYTSAFHSAYLFYPLTEPHGAVESGLVTLSRYPVKKNVRYQLPVSNQPITKFTDLDRCFTASYINVNEEQDLVLVNLHLSAYDKGGLIRQKQVERLNQFLEEEAAKGNYVIAGGDFNHDIAGSRELYPTEQEVPKWIYELTNEDLTAGYSFVIPENLGEVASCRGADIPYEKGVTYTAIVDGFIVSDNVTASSAVIQTNFAYSDHQPVKLTFSLKPDSETKS